MKFFKKKIFSVTAATLLGCGMSVYAVPVDEGGAIAVSRMDTIDYIILAGAALFLIGIISVLLSMYLGIRKKNAEALQDYEQDYEMEDYQYSDAEAEADAYEEEIIPEPEDVIEEENEIVDEAEENAKADDKEPEIEESDVPDEVENLELLDEEPEAVSEEEPEEEPKVRITLTGTNNADVKIMAFSSVATVGRRGTNDIMISDNAVSGSHCAFTYEDGVVYLKDCGSTNGTLLNGELIEMEEVHAGDIIVLGKHQYRLSIALCD